MMSSVAMQSAAERKDADGPQPRVQALADRLCGLLDGYAVPLYLTLLALFFVLLFAAACLLSVEADEAWMLMSTFHAFGTFDTATGAISSPTITSGGAHFLIHGLLSLWTEQILAHRVVSLAAAAGLFALVYRVLVGLGFPRRDALVGLALFAAVPGLLLQASLATAELLATTILLFACVYWVKRGAATPVAAILSGLLFGLACATRINCCVVLPVILLSGAAARGPARTRFLFPALTVGVALVTAGILDVAYIHAAGYSSVGEFAAYVRQSTGVGQGSRGVFDMLRYLIIGNAILPVWAILAIVFLWIAQVLEGNSADLARLAFVLLATGLISWAAWVVKAPIPHLRYLWPAIPFIWLAGLALLLARLLRQPSALRRLLAHTLAIAGIGYQLCAGAFNVSQGESLLLVYRAVGVSPLITTTRRFHAAADQRALAAFMAGQPQHARFLAVLPAAAYPVTLLSHRTVEPLERYDQPGPRYVLIAPADYAVWRPSTAFGRWLQDNTDLAFRRGDFAAFRLKAAVAPPAGFRWVGEDDLLP